MKTLIVNSDDYGRAASVSAGIREAHWHGIVTSTTAMLNMPDIEAELLTAQRACPRLGLGVHLTLTAEHPLLPPEQLPSLMALSASDRFPTQAQFAAGAGTLSMIEIRAEWRAQIDKFQRITQHAPTHLDSHHHTSYFTPALFETMLKLARDYHCAIRLPPARAGAEAFQPFLADRLAASDVPHPDFFETRFYGAGATIETLLEILDHLPEGLTEVMCHPGLPDAGLAALTRYNAERALELRVLTDERVLARVDALGIALRSFHALEATWKN
jgi:predicted glycoside hydrolase/deacetylase ChbG (UPF0249 family)